MNRHAGLSAVIVAGIVVLSAPASAAETFPGPFPARLVRVLDGDTIRVEIRLWFSQALTEDVRLAGIDAPESGKRAKCPAETEAAERARHYLAGLLAGTQIELWNVRREKYGRALASVTAGGIDVGEALLREGLARPYGGGRRQGWC